MANEELELLRLRAKAKLKLRRMQSQKSPEEGLKARAASTPGAQFIPDKDDAEFSPGTEALKEVGKGTLKNLPDIGAAVGSLTAGTTVGVGTGGLGALPAMAGGAALGAAAGESFKQIIEHSFGLDEAPESSLEAAKQIGTEGAIGAAGEVLSTATLGTAKYLGRGFKSVAKTLATKAIPLNDKALKTIGGPEGVKALGDMLDEYGIPDIPRNLRLLSKKLKTIVEPLGKSLEGAYKGIDDVAKTKYTGDQYIDATTAAYRELFEQSDNEAMDRVIKKLEKELSPKRAYTHKEIWEKVKQIANYGDDPLSKTFRGKLSMALRVTNEKLAREVADEGTVNAMRTASKSYNLMRTAQEASDAKLKKVPSVWIETMEGLRHVAAANVFGVPGAAVSGALTASKLTSTKLTASAAAKLGEKLLGQVTKMGPFGKTALSVANRKGLRGVVDWHQHQMLTNPSYRKRFSEVSEPGT